jgi:hypothetical protein
MFPPEDDEDIPPYILDAQVSCSFPLYPTKGEQPRLWFIVVGSRSLDGQGTQAYSA